MSPVEDQILKTLKNLTNNFLKALYSVNKQEDVIANQTKKHINVN